MNNGDLRENSGLAKLCQACRIQAVDSADWVDCKEAHGVFQRKRWWRWLRCEAGVVTDTMVHGWWATKDTARHGCDNQSSRAFLDNQQHQQLIRPRSMATSTNVGSSTGYRTAQAPAGPAGLKPNLAAGPGTAARHFGAGGLRLAHSKRHEQANLWIISLSWKVDGRGLHLRGSVCATAQRERERASRVVPD